MVTHDEIMINQYFWNRFVLDEMIIIVDYIHSIIARFRGYRIYYDLLMRVGHIGDISDCSMCYQNNDRYDCFVDEEDICN